MIILYVCEAWSFSLREEQRLRVFQNKVLRKVFGVKRDEITGEWNKLFNDNYIHSSPNIIRNLNRDNRDRQDM